MHEYMRKNTDTYRSLDALVPLAQSGKGARYLSIDKAIDLAKHAHEHNSAITTAENYSYDLANNRERAGKHNFFWKQGLPKGHTWASFYDILTEKFLELMTQAKKSEFDEYFHVWIGMKGDNSDL